MRKNIILIAFMLLYAVPATAQEEVQYRKFKFDDVSCDVGLRYNKTGEGMDMGVSAIAYGKGAEFRKWYVKSVKLSIDGEKTRPGKEEKFYVKKESLFRVPAAVVFAILGTQVDYGGSGLEKGITKAGMAVGLGLLVLQAHGEVTGEGCVFNIPPDMEKKILSGRDFVEIIIGNDDLHEEETIKVGIARALGPARPEVEFGGMDKAELEKFIDAKESEAAMLEKEQESYKYGVDAEYDNIQKKIEQIQTQRGIAYRIWLEKDRR